MTDKQDRISFEQVIERGCGIDIHKSILAVTVQGKGIKKETRSFGAFTETIEEMKTWLQTLGITHIVMESTGVYRKPVYNILEESFEIVLVNARHLKNIPGNKTDKKDSQCIAKFLLAGLLKGSFIPPKPTRELRDLTRYKRRIDRTVIIGKEPDVQVFGRCQHQTLIGIEQLVRGNGDQDNRWAD